MNSSAKPRNFLSKLKPYFGSMRILSRKTPVSLLHLKPRDDGASDKHCVVLHGWAADGNSMRALAGALHDLPAGADRHFWVAFYDTAWTRFPHSAAQIVAKLRATGHDFADTLLVGYSMGGLVARHMAALEFPCRALVSIVAPHHGPASWLPTSYLGPWLAGPHSLSPLNRDLVALNNHPRDAACRDRYHMFAMTYTDRLGHHQHDGIVTLDSALGEGLGKVASRETMHLKYSMVATFDSHWRCMFPRYIPEVLRRVETLMEAC